MALVKFFFHLNTVQLPSVLKLKDDYAAPHVDLHGHGKFFDDGKLVAAADQVAHLKPQSREHLALQLIPAAALRPLLSDPAGT